MSSHDLILRGAAVVGVGEADIGVSDGKISEIDSDLEGTASEVVDARGLHVFPGSIDAHVHFNEPGRTSWEGFATGSRALANRWRDELHRYAAKLLPTDKRRRELRREGISGAGLFGG